MIEGLILAVAVAGFVSLLVLPLAVCEIVRLGRRNRELAERNAVQAVLLHRLEWPLSVGEPLEDGKRVVTIITDEERIAYRAAVEAGYADLPGYVEKYRVN